MDIGAQNINHQFQQYNRQVAIGRGNIHLDFSYYLAHWRRRKQLARIALVLHVSKRRQIKNCVKRFWISGRCENRENTGTFYVLYPFLIEHPMMFRNYCRITPVQFEALLQLIQPHIAKSNNIRPPISSDERLLVTLRHLASGDSQMSLAYQFGLGKSTVCSIIYETCCVIWEVLSPTVLAPPTSQTWKCIASQFQRKWHFPNCVGAIDVKHIIIQAPPFCGSTFYNYKGNYSIVLLAACDADYKFTVVDIGAEGRRSDGGIFKKSNLGKSLANKEANLPEPATLIEGGRSMPYVFVGDEAFQLTEYLMRPYPSGRQQIDLHKKIFNYRLSRARRMIESTFGILANRWRILRQPLTTSVRTAQKIVEALVCLHNWIRETGDNFYLDRFSMVDESIRANTGRNHGLLNITRLGATTHSRESTAIRDEFARYFTEEGDVPWQWSLII